LTSAEETVTHERIAGRSGPDSVFDESGVASIFLFMLDRGKICADDLKELRGGYIHKMAVVERMVNQGYVTFELQERPNTKYLYELTNAGKTVAKLYEVMGSIGKVSKKSEMRTTSTP
jgi:DNA-binding HxlR family transcriptional regulator